MTVPGNLSSPLLATAAAAAGGTGAVATKSLRFNNDDSAHLTRTPSSGGNQKTWTWSGWVKRSSVSGSGTYPDLFGSFFGNSSRYTSLRFDPNDKLFFFGGAGSPATNVINLQTSQVFRDFSAWYHIVLAFDTTQSTASNRAKLYVNGAQITDFDTETYPAQNVDYFINQVNVEHVIGSFFGTGDYLDGYLADVYFIDGLALAPTSFGAFDDNGVWQAAAYSGTFGTNGFHLLDFENESTIGNDSSGNNNDFTATGFSTTAGAGNDVLFDVPTNGTQTDTGAGGEVSGCYCTLSPIDQRDGTLSNGNLDYDLGSGTKFSSGTIAVKSGKWFWEAKAVSGVTNGSVGGRFAISQTPTERHGENGPFTLAWHATAGIQTFINGTGTTRLSGTGYSDGDVLGLALDADNNISYWYKNGSLIYTYNFSSLVPAGSQFLAPSCWNGSSGTPKWEYNFGQRPFAHSARSNHKVLCTASFGTPTIADGSDHFEAKLYTSETTISGLSFSPGLVWLKRRSQSADNGIYDVVRGVNKIVYPNASNAEETTAGVSAFNSDGFDLGTNALFKGGGHSFVSWNWYAGSSVTPSTSGTITATSSHLNSTAGLNILKYNGIGDGSTETLGHSLSSAPEFILIKCLSNAADWAVYHKGLGTGQSITLNSSGGKDGTSMFTGTDPTSSVVHLKENSNRVQNSSRTYVAYLFHSVDGFSSIGSYEGTGSASTGAFVFCGFRPALVLIKRDGTASWCLYDTSRDPFNDATHVLNPDTNSAGNTNDAFVSDVSIDILSNGFRIVDTDGEINQSGDTYIYYAVAENPFSLSGGLAR